MGDGRWELGSARERDSSAKLAWGQFHFSLPTRWCYGFPPPHVQFQSSPCWPDAYESIERTGKPRLKWVEVRVHQDQLVRTAQQGINSKHRWRFTWEPEKESWCGYCCLA
jgi:hypothetical protein